MKFQALLGLAVEFSMFASFANMISVTNKLYTYGPGC